MKNNFNITIALLLLSLVITSCKKEESNTETTLGVYTDYYPLKIGSYHIYKVDSIFYNDFTQSSDTFEMQLKELITDTFLDEEQQLNYRIERFYKYKTEIPSSFDTLPWSLKNVWFVTLTDFSIQRVEENYRYTTLTNPIKNGITWDGNAFNAKDQSTYEYANFGESLFNYNNSVNVIQKDIENLIQKQYFEQYFAKDVGLTKYYYIDVESQNISDPSIPIEDRIEKGVQYSQELIEYFIPE